MSNGLIYGTIVLYADREDNPRLTLPFDNLSKVETGNHLNQSYDSSKVRAFDYAHGGTDVESAKLFVSTRSMMINGLRVGEDGPNNMVHQTIQKLLAMNSGLAEEEEHLSFLELTYAKVFSKLEGRLFISLDIVSTQPKFVLMTRNIPVYFLGVCDEHAMHLVWSNEDSLEERMKIHYGERFFYYRMRPLLNGVCVLQSSFLRNKVVKWRQKLSDRLKIMNALETQISRRSALEQLLTPTPAIPPAPHVVNTKVTTDEQTMKHQQGDSQ